MTTSSLDTLLYDLEQELLRLGYTEGSMRFYRRRWDMLRDFAAEQNINCFTEQLGIDFARKYFSIQEEDFAKTLSQAQTQDLRVIRMIGDFQLHRTVLRRYFKHKQILKDDYFIKISNDFNQCCIQKEYSKVTVEHYVKQSAYFMDYLTAQGVNNFDDISMLVINDYLKTLAGYTYKTVEQRICSLRAFFRYLLEAGEITTDFASRISMVKARKQTQIPSVWTHAELKKLIDAIDRGSPKGKRDYAIILLACRLGLRSTDIKNLKTENFHWADKKLIFVQSKTKQLLTLPLIPDVGWAVIDYLRYGRPKVDSPYIFVRHLAPFLPFSEDDHLNQLIKSYMDKAHIPVLNKRRGMHSLRHTMAGVLLENDTPLPIISDIIGHIDTNSTAVYLKVDLKRLVQCPLDFEGAIQFE